jgi:hypothetical protein
MGQVGGRSTAGADFATVSPDQPFIGRDQRDIRIDPQPSVAGEHLNVEMEVTGSAVGTVEIVGNDADFLAFLDITAIQNTIGIHG